MPYPGLRSFRRDEGDLFFGREDCINTMVDRLAANRLLAVLGSSGAGKSSVVKTGLLDALDLGVMAQQGSSWRVVLLRPGSTPLANLARGLLEAARPAQDVSDRDIELLRAFLVRGPRSVIEWCRDGHLPVGTNMLLLVDQFEELFRYQDYAGREEAEGFVALLLESARNSEFPIYVVITMRSEYLGACALIDGLAETISTSVFLTPRMTREQCRSAIVGPAAVCGIAIEDALVNRLLNDLAAFAPWEDRSNRDQLDRLVRRADQLPLLQYCLNRMFVRAQGAADGAAITLTLADYEKIGGLSGALNAHADEIVRALGPENRPVVESVFRGLTLGSTISDAVRRPTRLRELAEISNADEAQVRLIVDTFRAPGCNFLTPEFDSSNPTPLDAAAIVDISHESLIRQWRQLSEWLEKEARSLRQWRRLQDRFEDKDPLRGTELANMQTWRAEEKPNKAWAARHGGNFQAIMDFLDDSVRRERRFAPLVMPLFGLASLVLSMIFCIGILTAIFGTPTEPRKLLFYVGAYSVSDIPTYAFALWRYCGQSPKRAGVAGLCIGMLNFLLVAAFMAAFSSGDYTMLRAMRIYYAAFSAPVTLAVLAMFAPVFRKPFAWLWLVGFFDGFYGLLVLLYYTSEISLSEPAMELSGYCLALLSLVVFGFVLRRGGVERRS